MRVKWWWTVVGLVACGGSTGAITGEPMVEVVRGVDPPVVAVTTTTEPRFVRTDDVVSAFDRLMTIRLECGRRPGTCPVDDLAVVGSSMHTELVDLMSVRATSGITASSRGSLRYRVDDARVDGDVATVTTCLTDDTVMVMDGAVFDDSILSATVQWSMSLTETGWKWSAWRFVSVTREGDLCAFTG